MGNCAHWREFSTTCYTAEVPKLSPLGGEMQEILSALSAILMVLGMVPYAIAVYKGTCRPAKVSWCLWLTLDTITFIGMWMKHALNSQITACVIGGWITLMFVLWFGEKKKLTTLDAFVVVGAVTGLLLWAIMNDPIWAIVIPMLVLFLASFPTFANAWRDPSNENRLGWTIMIASSTCAVASMPAWTLADSSQPVSFLLIQLIMMYLLWVRPAFRNSARQAV